MRGFLILLSLAFAGTTNAQDKPRELVQIEVGGDPTYTIANTIQIISPDIRPARSQAELERRTWTAIRTSERGTQQATSETCEAVRVAALGFGKLPALSPITMGNEVVEGERAPPSPVMLHGTPTRVKFTAIDGTRVETTGGYAFRLWAHETVIGLNGCWGTLIPVGSSLPGT